MRNNIPIPPASMNHTYLEPMNEAKQQRLGHCKPSQLFRLYHLSQQQNDKNSNNNNKTNNNNQLQKEGYKTPLYVQRQRLKKLKKKETTPCRSTLRKSQLVMYNISSQPFNVALSFSSSFLSIASVLSVLVLSCACSCFCSGSGSSSLISPRLKSQFSNLKSLVKNNSRSSSPHTALTDLQSMYLYPVSISRASSSSHKTPLGKSFYCNYYFKFSLLVETSQYRRPVPPYMYRICTVCTVCIEILFHISHSKRMNKHI